MPSTAQRGASIPFHRLAGARMPGRTSPPPAIEAPFRTGLEGPDSDNVLDAIRMFKSSPQAADLLGGDGHQKYAGVERTAAEHSPRSLGARVKTGRSSSPTR